MSATKENAIPIGDYAIDPFGSNMGLLNQGNLAAENEDNSDNEEADMRMLRNLVKVAANFDNILDQLEALDEIGVYFNEPWYVERLLQLNILPTLVQAIKCDESTALQYSAVCIITDITMDVSNASRTVGDAGAIPPLINLLRSPAQNIHAQALMALINITADDGEMRDIALNGGYLLAMLSLVRDATGKVFLRQILNGIGSLCLYDTIPFNSRMSIEIFAALKVLVHNEDNQVAMESMSMTAEVLLKSNSYIRSVIKSGMVPKVIEKMTDNDWNLIVAALDVVGNIAAGTEEEMQYLLNNGALMQLLVLLEHRVEDVRVAATKFAARIAGGNADQVQAIIDLGLLPIIVRNLSEDGMLVQLECLSFMSHFNTNRSFDQVLTLIGDEVVVLFCGMLGAANKTLTLEILGILHSILQLAKRHGNEKTYIELIQVCGGLDSLTNLLLHSNVTVQLKTLDIVFDFFIVVMDLSKFEEIFKLLKNKKKMLRAKRTGATSTKQTKKYLLNSIFLTKYHVILFFLISTQLKLINDVMKMNLTKIIHAIPSKQMKKY